METSKSARNRNTVPIGTPSGLVPVPSPARAGQVWPVPRSLAMVIPSMWSIEPRARSSGRRISGRYGSWEALAQPIAGYSGEFRS